MAMPAIQAHWATIEDAGKSDGETRRSSFRFGRSNRSGVFAPKNTRRKGELIAISLAPGRYLDLWGNEAHTVPGSGVLQLTAADGIALLVRS